MIYLLFPMPIADALAAYDHLCRGAFGKIVIRVTE
jgi:hypothetical protein